MTCDHPIEHLVTVRSSRRLNSQTTVLTLEAPLIAATAAPGQFVNLSCEHFLRRPIGIMAVLRCEGLVELGIRVVGEGTRELAQKKARRPAFRAWSAGTRLPAGRVAACDHRWRGQRCFFRSFSSSKVCRETRHRRAGGLRLPFKRR